MKKHNECVLQLQDAQQTEYDLRELCREADHFLNKKDGQWEPSIISKMVNRPRYTFDECNPIVDDVMGEMMTSDFDIRVSPAGGDSTKETAKTYEGMIRNIENISGSKFVYMAAAKEMISVGISAFRIVSDYVNDNSFDQDLIIKAVPNVIDSLYFDPNAVRPDMADANYCYRLASMTRQAYEKKYPKGSGLSVGQTVRHQVYTYKKQHEVVIGEYLYKVKDERDLVLFSNGEVYPVDDKFQQIAAGLAQIGITETARRKRPYHRVYRKMFDGGDWLGEKEETPFAYLPIIPVYGNFRISENKVIYWGIVEKLMDPQRIINYALSRKIEEGALSGKDKIWATKDQVKSADVRRTLRTYNTNNDPVQIYDHVDGQQPPYFQGARQSNPGLVETAQNATQFIQRVSGTFDEARGQAPPNRSGTAIEKLQTKSDNPKRKWFQFMEVALCHACRILIDTIPRVYDTKRQIRIVEQDGTSSLSPINDQKINPLTNEYEKVNDLSAGIYDVTCSAGPAFNTRQQETVTMITEFARIDPSIMALGGDILLNNSNAPGMDLIGERRRAQMIQQGFIPPDQQTEKEKQIIAQQQQAQANKPPDPMTLAAQAEMAKAQASMQEAQLRADIENQKLELKKMEISLNTQIQERKLDQENNKQIGDSIKEITSQIKIQAETLKIIKEAMGAEAIINPKAAEAYNKQAEELNQSIERQP